MTVDSMCWVCTIRANQCDISQHVYHCVLLVDLTLKCACCAAAATSIIEQHELAERAGSEHVEQGPEAAVAGTLTTTSMDQMREDILSVIEDLAKQTAPT